MTSNAQIRHSWGLCLLFNALRSPVSEGSDEWRAFVLTWAAGSHSPGTPGGDGHRLYLCPPGPPMTEPSARLSYVPLVFPSSLLLLINPKDKLQKHVTPHRCSVCLFQHPPLIGLLQRSESRLLSLRGSAPFTVQC